MKRFSCIRPLLHLLSLALPAVLLPMMLSCKGGDSGEEKTGKLQYTPQINEVAVIELKKETFCRHILSNGKLAASAKASMSFGISGTVARVAVHNGQVVQAGETIAELDSRETALSMNSAALAFRKAELDLYDVLAGQGYSARDTSSVPRDILEMAKMRSGYLAARNDLSKAEYNVSQTVLKAPFRGRVADVKLREWDQASSSEPFCTVIDDSRFDVDFTVLEPDYSLLEPGLQVLVTPFGASGKVYYGKIVSINPVVDKNGQIAVRAQVTGDSSLIDGMNVKVTIEKAMAGMLVVPKSAVVIRDNMDVMFRYNGGKAEWVYVNILQSNSDSYAVEANSDRGAQLAEGESIIVSGNLNLADGSSVRLKD